MQTQGLEGWVVSEDHVLSTDGSERHVHSAGEVFAWALCGVLCSCVLCGGICSCALRGKVLYVHVHCLREYVHVHHVEEYDLVHCAERSECYVNVEISEFHGHCVQRSVMTTVQWGRSRWVQ
jgi:hypothetical protein